MVQQQKIIVSKTEEICSNQDYLSIYRNIRAKRKEIEWLIQQTKVMQSARTSYLVYTTINHYFRTKNNFLINYMNLIIRNLPNDISKPNSEFISQWSTNISVIQNRVESILTTAKSSPKSLKAIHTLYEEIRNGEVDNYKSSLALLMALVSNDLKPIVYDIVKLFNDFQTNYSIPGDAKYLSNLRTVIEDTVRILDLLEQLHSKQMRINVDNNNCIVWSNDSGTRYSLGPAGLIPS